MLLYFIYIRGDRRFEKPGRKEPGWYLVHIFSTYYFVFDFSFKLLKLVLL